MANPPLFTCYTLYFAKFCTIYVQMWFFSTIIKMFTKLIKLFASMINRNITSIMKFLVNISKSLKLTSTSKSKSSFFLKILFKLFGTLILGRLLYPILRFLAITIFGNNVFFSLFNIPLDNDFLWDMYNTIKFYILEYWYKLRVLISGSGLDENNGFLSLPDNGRRI